MTLWTGAGFVDPEEYSRRRKKMTVYIWAIVAPNGCLRQLSFYKEQVWRSFFNNHLHKLPLAEAIKAYEAIGYSRKRFRLVEELEEEKYETY